MTDVIIGGTRYIPEGTHTPRIGIGITTRNRADIASHSIAEIRRLTPNAKIVIVDDASTTPFPDATYRFTENAGIARAKNKCLELLADCDHIFLFDDDGYPLVDDWWKPYVESPEPHLMYIFRDRSGGPGELYRDDQHVAYTDSRGVMLYVDRKVLDVVGGMDPIFGTWGHEHPSWSDRIFNAGLTSWRYADVVDSARLICSLDEDEKVTRSVPQRERQAQMARNEAIYWQYRHEANYVEYSTARTVITTLLTGVVDPQRGQHMHADPALLSTLQKSLTVPLVVLHDQLNVESTNTVTYERVTASLNPYVQRWQSIYRYLRDHPELHLVWCVDGTDVEQLQDPFQLDLGHRLAVGTEHEIVGCDWMRSNHPNETIQAFIADHADLQLLNAGLVGGTRETVMAFLHDLLAAYWEIQTDLHTGRAKHGIGVGDMGLLNMVAYTKWAERLVTGPRVNTRFKADERTRFSLWKHK